MGLQRTIGTALTGLALLCSPVSAQEKHSWDLMPPSSYEVLQSVPRRMISVGIDAVVNTAIAYTNGRPVLDALRENIIISGLQGVVHGLSTYLSVEHDITTPLAAVSAGIFADIRLNSANGRPLCENVSGEYLMVGATFDCGEMSWYATATPLLGSAAFLVAGASFDLSSSLASGVSTFTYSGTGRLRSRGVAFPGAIGIRNPQPPANGLWVLADELPSEDKLRAKQRLSLLVKSAHQEAALVREHELFHVSQEAYVDALLDEWDVPWYVHTQTSVFGMRTEVSGLSLAFLGLNAIAPQKILPWEVSAYSVNSGLRIEGDVFRITKTNSSTTLKILH